MSLPSSRKSDGETLLGDDEYEQSKVVFGKIKNLVEAAGGKMDDVVKMTIFVTDIRKNTEVWRARAAAAMREATRESS